MVTIIRTEKRKRGFFGWLFLILFLGFNLIMAFWLFSYWASLSGMQFSSNAERTGAAIGGTIGSGLIVFFWVGGAIILGIFSLLTRGKKILIEETQA